jgi:hypothetical protein
MTAWDILTGNSIAPGGSDAWTHINNQAGGTGQDRILAGNIGQIITVNKTSMTVNNHKNTVLLNTTKNVLFINNETIATTIKSKATTI